MTTTKHKLCDLLEENLQIADIEEKLIDDQDNTEPAEAEVWQFDPGICG